MPSAVCFWGPLSFDESYRVADADLVIRGGIPSGYSFYSDMKKIVVGLHSRIPLSRVQCVATEGQATTVPPDLYTGSEFLRELSVRLNRG